jgi:tight adherence protein C
VLFVLAFLSIAAAVFLIAEVATYPTRQRVTSVRRAATYGRVKLSSDGGPRFGERVVTPLLLRIASLVLRFNPKTTVDNVASRLLAAGLAQKVTPSTFLATKGCGVLGGIAVGLLAGAAAGPVVGFLAAIVLAAIGFLGPDLVIQMLARSRRERVCAELPDALDLLAVSVEAGLGFDAAVARVTEHMEGPLADELALVLGEMRVGEGRQEALKKLSARINAPELGAFVRAIIQADQLGISLGRILRVQAADTRLRRQAAAEERAMKAPIKMLFPTVLFIFPAMFLVVLGPAMMQLLTLLNG